jgi:hypothetical protein
MHKKKKKGVRYGRSARKEGGMKARKTGRWRKKRKKGEKRREGG